MLLYRPFHHSGLYRTGPGYVLIFSTFSVTHKCELSQADCLVWLLTIFQTPCFRNDKCLHTYSFTSMWHSQSHHIYVEVSYFLFSLLCYVWLVSTFCSFLFMYVLLNLCYFVSVHCCPSFVAYMHSFFWWIVLLSRSKWPVGIVYSLMEYTGFTQVFFISKISVFSLLNKV